MRIETFQDQDGNVWCTDADNPILVDDWFRFTSMEAVIDGGQTKLNFVVEAYSKKNQEFLIDEEKYKEAQKLMTTIVELSCLNEKPC